MGSLSVFLVGILCLIIGAIVGGILLKAYSSESRKIDDLEKLLQEKQDELKNYQMEVTEHFSETANLLKQLAESYRGVHNHLAAGSQKLCETGVTRAPIIHRLAELNFSDPEPDTDPVAPPLDYAPRYTPYDRGTLDEGYGLEKVELEEKPVIDIADVIAKNAKTTNR